MVVLDEFLNNNNLQEQEDIECLLECASVARQLVEEKDYTSINRLINYTIQNSYYEALVWTIGIIREEFEKEDCKIENFYCDIGGRIPNYDEFIGKLNVEFNALNNSVEKIYDKNGEVESFFNILIYKTDYKNVYLVSAENFDTMDNDFIRYRLLFTRNSI